MSQAAGLPEGQHDQVQVQPCHERDHNECQEAQSANPDTRGQPSLKLCDHGTAPACALDQAVHTHSCCGSSPDDVAPQYCAVQVMSQRSMQSLEKGPSCTSGGVSQLHDRLDCCTVARHVMGNLRA